MVETKTKLRLCSKESYASSSVQLIWMLGGDLVQELGGHKLPWEMSFIPRCAPSLDRKKSAVVRAQWRHRVSWIKGIQR